MSGLIDPQRNLLTTLLVALAGALVVAAVVQQFVVGRVNIDRIPMIGSTVVGDSRVDVPETGLADFGEYTEITDRPVFFSDRRLPVVEIVEADDGVDDPVDPMEEESVEALKAVLAGIIITPEMRLALVRDESANKTVTLREGMSLEGEQAAWRLDSIAARTVNFVSVDGRQSELELRVNTAGLQAGSPGQVRTPASRAGAGESGEEPPREAEARDPEAREPAAAGEDDARARAEEVRRRVAERRAELRAEAERRAQQQRQRQDN